MKGDIIIARDVKRRGQKRRSRDTSRYKGKTCRIRAGYSVKYPSIFNEEWKRRTWGCKTRPEDSRARDAIGTALQLRCFWLARGTCWRIRGKKSKNENGCVGRSCCTGQMYDVGKATVHATRTTRRMQKVWPRARCGKGCYFWRLRFPFLLPYASHFLPRIAFPRLSSLLSTGTHTHARTPYTPYTQTRTDSSFDRAICPISSFSIFSACLRFYLRIVFTNVSIKANRGTRRWSVKTGQKEVTLKFRLALINVCGDR